jgi:DNA-directed RNA polymerase specialized sigma24 family protein
MGGNDMQGSKGEQTSEIAAAVQAGKADILRLWAAVERFAWQQSLRWARAMEGRAGVEESDLLQVAFIALMDTLPTWDVNKGEFLTLYGIKLKAEFTEACGQRTQRTRCDPINTVCRSIGDEDSDLTLGDTISDEAAEEAFENVEQRDFQQAVQAALAQLPNAQREAIIGEFWFGRKPDPKLRREALRALRHPRIRKPLMEYY